MSDHFTSGCGDTYNGASQAMLFFREGDSTVGRCMNQNHEAQPLVQLRLLSVWYAGRVHGRIRPSDQPKWHNIDDC